MAFGPGQRVDSLLKQGAVFFDVPSGLPTLLERTFNKWGAGRRVDFLLQHGAKFADVPLGLPSRLEWTFKRCGTGLSADSCLQQYVSRDVPIRKRSCHEWRTNLDFLVQQGANPADMPSGLPVLLERVFEKWGTGRHVDFLLEHGAKFVDVPDGLPDLLQRTFVTWGPGPRVDFLSNYVISEMHELPFETKMFFLGKDIPGDLRSAIALHLRSRKTDTFVATGDYESIAVHKDVLGYWSDYWEALFSNGWQNKDPLDAEIVSRESLDVVLHFMYTGEYIWKNHIRAYEDWAAADYLQIEALVRRI